VDLDELENDIMRSIERVGHYDRMQVAFGRDVVQQSELLG
jgi:hypothetical protein